VTFEIELNGRTHTVVVESVGAAGPAGGRFRVRIDGELHEVSARPTDLGLSILAEEDGRSLDVAVTANGAGERFVQLPHVGVTVVVDGRRSRRAPVADPSGPGEQRVMAPMPGRVVRVLVKAGDTVAARQGLVVVEAMKMENELGSPKAGVVKEIAVTEGVSVEAGRLLVVIE
jgi:biotin carboxyl carrier protein